MVKGSFQVGQRFFFQDEACRFVRKAEPNMWTFECLSSNRWREESLENLLAYWSEGKLQFPGGSEAGREGRESAYRDAAVEAFRQSYPGDLWRRAKAKLVYVTRLRRAPLTETIIKPLIQEIYDDEKLWKDGQPFKNPPHFTTVATWRRSYHEAGEDIRALCDRDHCKGNSESRYGSEVDELADDVIETCYLKPERPTIESCLEILRGRVARANQTRLESERLQRPTYGYLKHRISNLNRYEVCVARYGKRLADIRFRAAGLGPRADAPLARASIDHCQLNVMVVDDETGLPLGRPWLTLVLDEATRYILGFYLGFEEPSAVSVVRATRCALMPKGELLAECPDLANGWDAWGVMEVLVADNGMELHGGTLENVIGRFGIVLQFCPRKKPWFKGKIERFFGTINTGLLDTLPGKTFSSISEKFDYDPAKHALVGLKALRRVILTWIVDIYHQKSHRGLGTSPAAAWMTDISSVDRWLPPNSLSVQAAFSRSATRRLTHKGIEFDGLLYNSNDLRALRELHGSEITVEVRVMDDDIGSLVVVSPDGHELIRVPALDQAYAAGMTRWQHRVCKRYQRRLRDDDGLDIRLLEARERIQAALEQERGKAKRLSKRIGRFLEGSDRNASMKPEAEEVVARNDGLECLSMPDTEAGLTCGDDGEGDWVPELSSRRVDVVVGDAHGVR
ncbi:Mu transposase C-terminal domain-containing protein [Marilutibacter maris]|uniref:Mu transposase C-terminal domain-containing protein n=1 Tax=Marilutibacter maris TaxID=1605891 RepID=UPI000DA73789|nr:Mu transposase C-terminal domain-containing protein [Lysobacter maris]